MDYTRNNNFLQTKKRPI